MTDDIHAQIQKTYAQLRQAARDACDRSIAELYQSHPLLQELTQAVTETKSALIKAELHHAPKQETERLQKELETLSAQRNEYIENHQIDMNIFRPAYSCTDCSDTGKLPDGTRCHCYTEHFARLRFSAEDASVLDRENFSTFDETVFPAGPQRDTMVALRDRLEKYCRNYPDVKNRNITIMGQAGSGKTFLLNCMAKALMDRSFSVIRLSAYKMMNELFSLYISDNGEFDSVLERLCTVDVLIVDDLGTELRKENFTLNTLYYLFDRRAELQKALLVSTNLTPEHISQLYSERLLSRLINAGTTASVRLTGTDVRLKRTSK